MDHLYTINYRISFTFIIITIFCLLKIIIRNNIKDEKLNGEEDEKLE